MLKNLNINHKKQTISINTSRRFKSASEPSKLTNPERLFVYLRIIIYSKNKDEPITFQCLQDPGEENEELLQYHLSVPALSIQVKLAV